MDTRKGDWILTASGRKFWPLDPRPEDVSPEDIAHALSMLCRYTGHCRSFYSVAQHSVIVADYLLERFNDPRLAFAGLLHDATEAYMGDIARPWKRYLFASIGDGVTTLHAAEDELAKVIYAGLGVPFPSVEAWKKIKHADNVALVSEYRDLMIQHPDWHYSRANGYEAVGYTITPMNPGVAEGRFLSVYAKLHAMTK